MKIKLFWQILLITALLTGITQATIFIGTDDKSFQSDTIYNDDVFISGNSIRFQSQVTGDLIGASQELVFSGTCDGNINWASRWLTINGSVDGSLRGFAQTIDINAPIGRNLLAFAQNITIGPSTYISRDAYLFGEEIIFKGNTDNLLHIKGDKVVIAGNIGGDLNISANQIEIKPSTTIEGDLIYESYEKIKFEESVHIAGKVDWTELEKEDKESAYHAFQPINFMLIMYLIINFFFSLIVLLLTLLLGNKILIPLMYLTILVSGLVIVSINKSMALKAVKVIQERFMVALGLGILLILLFPIAAFLATLTIVGIPLGIIIVFTFGIFSFAGAVYSAQYVGIYIGRLLKIERQPSSAIYSIIGIIFLATLILIPIIGWLVAFLTLALGLGSLTLSLERFKGKFISAKQSESSIE